MAKLLVPETLGGQNFGSFKEAQKAVENANIPKDCKYVIFFNAFERYQPIFFGGKSSEYAALIRKMDFIIQE